MYLFFGCAGSLLLLGFFSSCDEQGLLSSCCAWSLRGGFSCCGVQALEDVGLVALWHVKS